MKKLEQFRVSVFELIKKIPRGKVVTYKQIALRIGIKNPRLVGAILNTNTNPAIYPCHRVVRSDRTVATGYAFGGPDKQIELLKLEGVSIVNGKIDASSFINL